MNLRTFISSVQVSVRSTFCNSLMKSSTYSSIVSLPCFSWLNSLTHLVFFRSVTNFSVKTRVKSVNIPPCHRTRVARLVSYHLLAAPCRYTATTCNFRASFHWFVTAMSLNICNHFSTSSSDFLKKKVGFAKTGTCAMFGGKGDKGGCTTIGGLGVITRGRLFQGFLLRGFN